MIINTYSREIISLKPNEVFVFGSNLSGFHGAGAAGFATFNKKGNIWREFDYDKWPNGKKGKWNIKGVGWGYQEGEIGKSYAIPTVKKPGEKRSMPLIHIRLHIETFNAFSKAMSHLSFYVAQGPGGNLNGYSTEELQKIWFDYIGWPENVYFSEEFIKGLE